MSVPQPLTALLTRVILLISLITIICYYFCTYSLCTCLWETGSVEKLRLLYTKRRVSWGLSQSGYTCDHSGYCMSLFHTCQDLWTWMQGYLKVYWFVNTVCDWTLTILGKIIRPSSAFLTHVDLSIFFCFAILCSAFVRSSRTAWLLLVESTEVQCVPLSEESYKEKPLWNNKRMTWMIISALTCVCSSVLALISSISIKKTSIFYRFCP